MTHKVTVYDIFLCTHIHKYTRYRVGVRNVKCHPKFNLVEGVLSQGGFVVLSAGLGRQQRLSTHPSPARSTCHDVITTRTILQRASLPAAAATAVASNIERQTRGALRW